MSFWDVYKAAIVPTTPPTGPSSATGYGPESVYPWAYPVAPVAQNPDGGIIPQHLPGGDAIPPGPGGGGTGWDYLPPAAVPFTGEPIVTVARPGGINPWTGLPVPLNETPARPPQTGEARPNPERASLPGAPAGGLAATGPAFAGVPWWGWALGVLVLIQMRRA